MYFNHFCKPVKFKSFSLFLQVTIFTTNPYKEKEEKVKVDSTDPVDPVDPEPVNPVDPKPTAKPATNVLSDLTRITKPKLPVIDVSVEAADGENDTTPEKLNLEGAPVQIS